MWLSVVLLALSLGLTSAAPVDDAPAVRAIPSAPAASATADDAPFPYTTCAFRDRLRPRVATVTSWITDCGDKTGHTTGMRIAWQGYNGLCFPLPDTTRALEITEIREGCSATAFESPVCDDYPWDGAWWNATGCLWTGNREHRSYKISCDDDNTVLG